MSRLDHHAHLDFSRLRLRREPPTTCTTQKNQSAWRFKFKTAQGLRRRVVAQLSRCQLGPPGNAPKISPRGSRGGRRHPAAGAIQGPGRPARGAFAPGPVEGRCSAVQNSSASFASAACGARLELKPHCQNRNAALARSPRECIKHGASSCEPGFFSPAAPTTHHHHHLHHAKISRS
jgi:hypothetical protein